MLIYFLTRQKYSAKYWTCSERFNYATW